MVRALQWKWFISIKMSYTKDLYLCRTPIRLLENYGCFSVWWEMYLQMSCLLAWILLHKTPLVNKCMLTANVRHRVNPRSPCPITDNFSCRLTASMLCALLFSKTYVSLNASKMYVWYWNFHIQKIMFCIHKTHWDTRREGDEM